MFRRLITRSILLFAMAGVCHAGDAIEASSMTNPAPAEALSGFDRFEVSELEMGAPYAGQKVNDKAKATLQLNLSGQVLPWTSEKNALAPRHDPPRVLRIEPRVAGIKTVSKAGRFWAGAFAGKSRILIKVRLVDAATDQTIAEPEFYQHASAMAGAYSGGAADVGMLERIAVLVRDYLSANYESAVGGPTGKPAD